MTVPPEKGVKPYRVRVQRNGEDIIPMVKNSLGPVSVMHVYIKDDYPFKPLKKSLRGNRGVVEITESPGHIRKGMVPGRAAKRVNRSLSLIHI